MACHLEREALLKTIMSALIAAVLAAGALQAARGANDGAKNAAPTERIGVYDSRAVAVAYVDSMAFKKWLAEMKGKRDRANMSGNQKQVKKIENEIIARQQLMHKQGFGTEPVDDILSQINDKLPAIKKKAGVDAIVSKWDKNALEQHAAAGQVDVTTMLIDALNPGEKQRKAALDIQKSEPVSNGKAARIKN